METLKSGRAKEYWIESIRFDFLLETMPIRRQEWRSQGAERKKLSAKNSMSSKTILQK